ncbi:hypothetical protein Ssi03_17120 [Sphaerisporangium siamense]|nr:hypothetical protein Ssi03_17120 [Sphaerisporangium siamense]
MGQGGQHARVGDLPDVLVLHGPHAGMSNMPCATDIAKELLHIDISGEARNRRSGPSKIKTCVTDVTDVTKGGPCFRLCERNHIRVTEGIDMQALSVSDQS